MKTWFTKFKISNALNDRRPFSADAGAAIAQSADAHVFSEQAVALDQRLKNSTPVLDVPASQHTAIMRAIRAAEMTPKFSRPKVLIPAIGMTLVIFVATIVSLELRHQKSAAADSALALATTALQTREVFAQSFPAATQPLADEMTLLNRDATNAQNFLLASLP